MGLGGLFKRLAGGDTNKGGNAFCFVFGPDKRHFQRMLESQGSHIQDNTNRLAYFSSPEGIGTLRRKSNGMTRTLGPVSMAYELITELYSFPLLNWAPDRQKQDQGTDGHHELYEKDEILDNGFAEGFALAHQQQSDEEMRKKLVQILLLAVLGAVIMFLLIAISTGLLSNFLSAIPKFFGGG